MSQPLIIGAVTVAVLDTTITDLKSSTGKAPAAKIVIGGFVVMVGLLALSDYKEDIADSLAILILLATLVGPKGGALSKLLSGLTSGDKQPVSVPPTGTTSRAYSVAHPPTYTQN